MLAKGRTCAEAKKLVAFLITSHPNKRAELVEIRSFEKSRDAWVDNFDRQEKSERTAPFHLSDGLASSNLVTAFRHVESDARRAAALHQDGP